MIMISMKNLVLICNVYLWKPIADCAGHPGWAWPPSGPCRQQAAPGTATWHTVKTLKIDIRIEFFLSCVKKWWKSLSFFLCLLHVADPSHKSYGMSSILRTLIRLDTIFLGFLQHNFRTKNTVHQCYFFWILCWDIVKTSEEADTQTGRGYW